MRGQNGGRPEPTHRVVPMQHVLLVALHEPEAMIVARTDLYFGIFGEHCQTSPQLDRGKWIALKKCVEEIRVEATSIQPCGRVCAEIVLVQHKAVNHHRFARMIRLAQRF